MKNSLITSLIIPIVTSIIASIITFILSNYFLHKEKVMEQRKKYFVLLDLICSYLIRILEIEKTIDTVEKRKIFEKEFRSEYRGSLHREITIPTFACIGKNLQNLVELQGKREGDITNKVKYIYKYLNIIPYKETLQFIHNNSYTTVENTYYNFEEFIKAVKFVLEENEKYYKIK